MVLKIQMYDYFRHVLGLMVCDGAWRVRFRGWRGVLGPTRGYFVLRGSVLGLGVRGLWT